MEYIHSFSIWHQGDHQSSYLFGCAQVTEVDSGISTESNILCGVPQGPMLLHQ